jgi:hypothetical protein
MELIGVSEVTRGFQINPLKGSPEILITKTAKAVGISHA